MLRWIAFDAVGTLIKPDPDVATAYSIIGQRHGSRLTPEELRLRFHSAFAESTIACLPTENGELLTSEGLERDRWQWIVARTLDDVGNPAACFAELFDHFARPENWRLFGDVDATLMMLRARGFRIALASNFDQRLHAVCRGFPELQGVEQIVVSTAVGACKPSSRFYAGLLAACGCAADELFMVGDEFEADVAGPKRMGIRSLLVDRSENDFSLVDLLAQSLDARY
jgi:putative hydrolase of the HAD superfamily